MEADEINLRAVGRRIEWLEKENRRLKILGVLVAVVVVAVVWWLRPSASSSVAAQFFVLNDASGVRRAEVSVVMNEPLVTVYDDDGSIRGAFRIGANGLPRYQPGTGLPSNLP